MHGFYIFRKYKIIDRSFMRVGKSQRVVEAVGITVVGLGVFRVLYHNVGREHPANKRVIHSSVHVYQAEVAVVFVHTETSVESGVYVVVCECF